MLKELLKCKINMLNYAPLVILLCLGCKGNGKITEKLKGKWYGQRQGLGSTYAIAKANILKSENNRHPKNEYANFVFTDGWLLMEVRDNENTVVDSAKYIVSEDSILIAGNYKTKVMKVTKDSLLLYSKDERILKSLRIFTREK